MTFDERDTVGYRLVIFFITLTFTIVGICNISNYNAILNDENEANIGLSKGTVIWFKYLNIILVIICLCLFLYNLFRSIYVKSVKITIPSVFTKEATGFSEGVKTDTPATPTTSTTPTTVNQALLTGSGANTSQQGETPEGNPEGNPEGTT
jgi:hypothetical protein